MSSSTDGYRSIGFVGWSSKDNQMRGNAGGSSTPQQRPKIFATAAKAIAYTTGDTAKEVFVRD